MFWTYFLTFQEFFQKFSLVWASNNYVHIFPLAQNFVVAVGHVDYLLKIPL